MSYKKALLKVLCLVGLLVLGLSLMASICDKSGGEVMQQEVEYIQDIVEDPNIVVEDHKEMLGEIVDSTQGHNIKEPCGLGDALCISKLMESLNQ
jgi:hypothetical protein